MVAPIWGPFSKVTDRGLSSYRVQSVYKQRPPYTSPATYSTYGAKLRKTANPSPNFASAYLIPPSTVETYAITNQARIMAYDKLKSKIVDKSSFGENLFQLGKSMDVIRKRALQLGVFTLLVKKGQFKQAAQVLGMSQPRKRHPIQHSGANWLEFHLGIEPVVKDIYNAIDLIQRPIKPKKVRGRGFGGPVKFQSLGSGTWAKNNFWTVEKVRIQYECEVAVSNPTLWLANTLGLVNPVQVAWQLVPLSFVLDWFVNVESFLGHASDFWGLSVSNSTTTLTYNITWLETWNTYGWQGYYDCWGMTRGLGLSLPSLGLRPLKAISWQRGLTAVSLLIGGLKSLDPVLPSHSVRNKGKYYKFSLDGAL